MSDPIAVPDAATAGVMEALSSSLSRGRQTLRSLFAIAGPAVVVSIAYMDPGNIAANIQAGAAYGYQLVWVVLVSSAVAILFQCLSARLGVATGRSLAEVCRERFAPTTIWLMWATSELAAMATDLAEFLGASIGFALLLHTSLSFGMGIVGVLTYAILAFQKRGFRLFELVIAAFVAIISLTYLAQLAIVPLQPGPLARAVVHPRIADHGALVTAVAILGATVMPHALFLHSGLAGCRICPQNASQRRRLLDFVSSETIIALTAATFVNVAMVVVAAGAFHSGHAGMADLSEAFVTLRPLFGPLAAALFLVGLLASGLSSSVVGTLAGQMIMQGFTGRRIPLWLRRAITMAPAYLTVAAGVDSTRALILSQVILSLTLPVPMIALVRLTGSNTVMGAFANSNWLTVTASACAIAVTALNVWLVVQTLA